MITFPKFSSPFWCHLYHRWGGWIDKTGNLMFQYRTCKRCGLTRSRWI